MKIRISLAAALVLASAAALLGCVSSKPYQTTLAPRPEAGGRLPGPPPVQAQCATERACVAFVEYDDYGNPFNRGQLQGVVDAAARFAQAGGVVLVYVHGWHNDAANGTRDVEEFRQLVARVSEMDTQPRSERGGAGRVLGIYVGWRGDSIASSGVTAPFSYLLTFWDRKEAAHQIGGSGGVYELFTRLSAIRRRHKDSRLLIHGHSFGGAVVYSTFSQSLIDQILQDEAGAKPAPSPVADLVLLINPAFEAMKLRPQFELARSQEYQPKLPPRLVVLTTEADWATGTTFPIGRGLGTLFAAYADTQSPQENTTAVGHHLPLITHQLAKPAGDECVVKSSPITLGTQDNALTSGPAPIGSLDAIIDSGRGTLCVQPIVYDDAAPLMLRRCDKAGDCATVAGQHYIARGPVAHGYVPYRLPLMNIRTTADVSDGHSDIRTKTLENFVVQLMALAVRNPDAVPLAPRRSQR